MASKKSKNPELTQAADSLAEAAHHVGKAVSQKVDEIGAAATAELNKVKSAAKAKGGQAQGKLETLIKRAETKLKKATVEA
jgi:hypothetical protein